MAKKNGKEEIQEGDLIIADGTGEETTEEEETVEQVAEKEAKAAPTKGATKEELLAEILAHKQTAASLLEKFGYQEERVEMLKELEKEGKIKIVEGFQKGSRLFFVKPNFDVETLKKDVREEHITKKVKKYAEKKEKAEVKEGEKHVSAIKTKKEKKVVVEGTERVSRSSIIRKGFDDKLSIEDITKLVIKEFPNEDAARVKNAIFHVKSALKTGKIK
jgi:hypothetical protein